MVEFKYNVRSLTCKRDLEMAIISYQSFLKFNQDITKLIVHTDGSLSGEDMERLYDSVNNILVVDRTDCKEEVEDFLSKYPNCLKYRNLHPLSNKIIDISILENDCIRYIDCDILFIKSFSDIFSPDCSSRFCLEDDCGYSARLIDLIRVSENQIPRCCNTGIFQISKKMIDFDYIEWFLSQEHLCRFQSMIEQTLFAIFMGSKDSHHYMFNQVSTSKNKILLNEKTIALHFMYGLKELFFNYADKFINTFADTFETFEFSKAIKLDITYTLKRAFKRKFKRLVM